MGDSRTACFFRWGVHLCGLVCLRSADVFCRCVVGVILGKFLRVSDTTRIPLWSFKVSPFYLVQASVLPYFQNW